MAWYGVLVVIIAPDFREVCELSFNVLCILTHCNAMQYSSQCNGLHDQGRSSDFVSFLDPLLRTMPPLQCTDTACYI